ncbi:unnamed protein product [Lathyrus oleraceus]
MRTLPHWCEHLSGLQLRNLSHDLLHHFSRFPPSIGTIVLPPSPDADRSIARSTTQLARHQDADSSRIFCTPIAWSNL